MNLTIKEVISEYNPMRPFSLYTNYLISGTMSHLADLVLSKEFPYTVELQKRSTFLGNTPVSNSWAALSHIFIMPCLYMISCLIRVMR